MKHIKELKFGRESRDELIKGINVVADAVSSTMGAQGRNVLYETTYGKPKSTKDGVTVANNTFLEEPLHSLGAEIIKEAAEKTVNECGDSTTNTTVLSREIIKLANDEVNKGAHPIQLKRGIEYATEKVLNALKEDRVKLKKRDYYNVAHISSNNDKALGKVISDAFKKSGKNGVVLHDKSSTDDTHIMMSEGMLIERGYSNKTMITDKTSNVMELEEPYLFICDKKIDNINEIKIILDFIKAKRQEGKDVNVLIIGELEQKVEDIISQNRRTNGLKLFYVKAPSHASKRTDLLEDLAVATGANLIRRDSTDNFAALGFDVFGRCKKVKATDKETIIDPFKNEFQEAINDQISTLNKLKSKASSTRHKLQKSFLEERIAKLSCSVATIMVGANSEVELDEKIDRVDDAIHSLRSAIEEGIVLGGGLALYNASFKISRDSKNTEDFNKGFKVVQEAIRKPFRQIISNAGLEDKLKDIENDIMSSDSNSLGYNVSTFEYSDFYKDGIIDPHKAIRCALQNASSVASTFLLTNTTITIKRDESNSK